MSNMTSTDCPISRNTFDQTNLADATKPTDESDERLIERHQQGDAEAFEVLYQRHYNGVESFVVNYLTANAPGLRSSHAADLIQDIFIYLHAHRFDVTLYKSHFLPWLYTTAKRLVVDRIRYETCQHRDYRRVSSQPIADLIDMIDTEAAPDLEQRVRNRRLLEYDIHQLPPNHQRAMRYIYEENLTNQETARIMGVTRTAVDWWRRESLTLLRLLAEKGDSLSSGASA